MDDAAVSRYKGLADMLAHTITSRNSLFKITLSKTTDSQTTLLQRRPRLIRNFDSWSRPLATCDVKLPKKAKNKTPEILQRVFKSQETKKKCQSLK